MSATNQSNNSNSLKRAGDVRFREVLLYCNNGNVLNITNQVMSVELVENIFEPFITGVVSIDDGVDIFNNGPLIGQEMISIDFETPTLTEYRVQQMFVVCGMSDSIKNGERSAVYQLRIISAAAINDNGTRISRTFKGKPEYIIQQLIGDIGLKSSKPVLVENTSNEITFISNWWVPTKCINYICQHTLNANNSPTYLFYEGLHTYYFTSLDSSFKDREPQQKFTVDDYSVRSATNIDSTVTVDINKDYQTIMSIDYRNGFNYFDRTKLGYYGSEVIGFDCVTQQYTHSIVNVNNTVIQNHLNKYNCVPSNVIASTSTKIDYVPYVTQNFNDQNQGIYDSNATYIGLRSQFLAQLGTNVATIKVHGRCDYYPGMIVELSVPHNAPITKDNPKKLDQLISGKYVVSCIKHIVSHGSHVCVLQLMKDSYVIDPFKGALAKDRNIEQDYTKYSTSLSQTVLGSDSGSNTSNDDSSSSSNIDSIITRSDDSDNNDAVTIKNSIMNRGNKGGTSTSNNNVVCNQYYNACCNVGSCLKSDIRLSEHLMASNLMDMSLCGRVSNIHSNVCRNTRYDVSTIVGNMCILAENVLEKIVPYLPGGWSGWRKQWQITGGYRSSSANGKSDHLIGCAVDIQLIGDRTQPTHKALRDKIASILPTWDQLAVETSDKTHNSWVHIGYNKNRMRKQTPGVWYLSRNGTTRT